MPTKGKTAAKKSTTPALPAKKRGRPATHNWEQAARWFIEGIPEDPDEPDGDRDWLNLRQLSEKTGIKYEQVRARASADRWSAQRADYQRRTAIERQKKRMAALGTQAVEFDSRMYDQAKVATQLIGVRLGELVKEVNIRKELREEAMERLKNGLPVEKTELYSAVRYTEMKELAQAASMWQDIGRKALGTDVQQVHIEADVNVDTSISVAGELERDDPDRLAGFMAAAERSGLLDVLRAGMEEDDVVDGEVVEDEGEGE